MFSPKLAMISTILLTIQAMPADDYVGFTFFVGCMAMMAASAFFFLSMSSVKASGKHHPRERLDHIHRCCSLLLHARLLAAVHESQRSSVTLTGHSQCL